MQNFIYINNLKQPHNARCKLQVMCFTRLISARNYYRIDLYFTDNQMRRSASVCTTLLQTFVVLFSLKDANLSLVNVDARISTRVPRAYRLQPVFYI